jgi:RNA polymerase sigma-54 factor
MANQGLHQVQKQAQTLVLAPQLRQSLKILQTPALELRQAIREELEANPLLEEMPMDTVSIEEQTRDDTLDDNHVSNELDFSDDFRVLKKLDEDWRDYLSTEAAQQTFTSEDAERRQHFFDSVVAEKSLQQHLSEQAELSETKPGVRTALNYLIGSLDDHGFLKTTASEVALAEQLPLRDVQEAIDLLKTFDPPGIGCFDTRESLLQQLILRGQGESVAARILRDHFALLLRRRIPEIARKLGVTLDHVQDAIERISDLDPAPGRRFGEDQNRVVNPDVKVEKDGDQWQVILNNDYIPRLRLSQTYKDMIAKGHLSAKDREYIQEKMRSGKFLISSIEQRQQTIERITRELLRVQQDFFEHGVSHLRPLTMNQVAQAVGVHETTVSRAIANKYIDTPHGLFELKYFFTPGYKGGDGQSVSNTTIKDQIAGLIENEDNTKPLSDQDIVEILKEKDIRIARRTVAKYREELGIPPTSLRRRYR